MEVHKHPHHVMHKKKWTEYLLEFFMLFLAVFLGFVAENIREHIIEKEKLERHMHTMVEDLKYDTTRYGGNLRANLNTSKGLDSFRYQILEAIDGKVDANRLYYYYTKYGRTSASAILNGLTMEQLKSSGLLRIIKNDSLAAQIGDYYERMYRINDIGMDALRTAANSVHDVYRQFFSYVGFEELIQPDTLILLRQSKSQQDFVSDILNRNPPLELYPADKTKFKQLYDAVAGWELALHTYNGRLRYCQQGADSLMKHIKEEYDFE